MKTRRICAVVVAIVLTSCVAGLAATIPTITISPTEVKLVSGNPDMVRVNAYFDGPSLVGLVHDGCWNSPAVNITGWKSDHTGGALVTSSSYTVFLQARQEAGECTMTFEAELGKITKSVHVIVAKGADVSIDISPSELHLNTLRSTRVTATARATTTISLLRNTCTGSNPMVTVVSSNIRGATATLDLLGKRGGECEMTFFAGSNVTKVLNVKVSGP